MGRFVLTFACTLFVACGGRSSDADAAGMGGTPAAGTAGAVSAGGAGGAAGTGSGLAGAGTGGTAPTCQWPDPACLRDCATPGFVGAVCVEGEWQCPDGGARYDECPLDSCSRDNGECCDHETGHLSASECGADGKRLPCDGTATHIENKGACVPDVVNVTDCDDLDGQACEAGLECANAGGCRLFCICLAEDAGLVWVCTLPVC